MILAVLDRCRVGNAQSESWWRVTGDDAQTSCRDERRLPMRGAPLCALGKPYAAVLVPLSDVPEGLRELLPGLCRRQARRICLDPRKSGHLSQLRARRARLLPRLWDTTDLSSG